jgi:tRNA dimethylallyltransferase
VVGHAALIGPTASGKSSIAQAIALADRSWELVTVDSMQVYRGMDVGTAKPTPAERAEVPHHLLDLADPWDDHDVATYQAGARQALADIESRGRRALLVGGTALYLRAVVDDLTLPGQFPQVRAQLEAEADSDGVEALHRRLAELDAGAAERMEPTNRRRVVRALEVTLGSGRPFSSFGPGLDAHPATAFRLVGLRWDRLELDERIAARYRLQLQHGFLDEVRALVDGPEPMSRSAAQALGYKELTAHVRGECSLEEALDLAIRRTRRFARRQERWFRRDPRIDWVDITGEPADHVERVREALDRPAE